MKLLIEDVKTYVQGNWLFLLILAVVLFVFHAPIVTFIFCAFFNFIGWSTSKHEKQNLYSKMGILFFIAFEGFLVFAGIHLGVKSASFDFLVNLLFFIYCVLWFLDENKKSKGA